MSEATGTSPSPPSPPAHTRLKAFAFVWLFRLFSVWIVLLAIAFVSVSVEGTLARNIGTERTAVVTRVSPYLKDRTGKLHIVYYSYDVGVGSRVADDDTLDANRLALPTIGDRVPVMTLPFGLLHRSVLRDMPPARGLVCLVLFTLMWCVGTMGVLFQAWVLPWREGRRGQANLGATSSVGGVPNSM